MPGPCNVRWASLGGKTEKASALLVAGCAVYSCCRWLLIWRVILLPGPCNVRWASLGKITEKASALLTNSCRVRRLFMLSLVQQ